MRLYATTTSERATKGQGGNKYLDIVIDIEHPDKTRERLATLAVVQDDMFFYLKNIKNLENGGNNNRIIEQKAKKL